MAADRFERLSRFLSFVLRHKPEAIGLTLDPNGWAQVDELIAKCNDGGAQLSREVLVHIVGSSDKKRFSLSADQMQIRAAQGHSVPVDLGLRPRQPPPVLYHGTATRFLAQIMSEGLKPMDRQHVHLSFDPEVARRIGERYGRPVVLRVDSHAMSVGGHLFYLADNGVWLADHVPAGFLEPIASSSSVTDSATTSRQPKLSR